MFIGFIILQVFCVCNSWYN